jgi:hypothetical protein
VEKNIKVKNNSSKYHLENRRGKVDSEKLSKFYNEKPRTDVNNGNPLGPVKCVSEKSASGKNFFNLIDV